MAETGFANLGVHQPFHVTINSSSTAIVVATAANLQVGSPGVKQNHPMVKLRIIAMDLHLSAAGTLICRSGADDVGRITRTAELLAITLPRNADGWFDDGNAGQQYTLGNAGEVTVSGTITFVKI